MTTRKGDIKKTDIEKLRRKNEFFKELSRRDYIIKASEIVRNEGRKALTIRRMATELDCTSACLYHYFANIEELFYYTQIEYLNYYIDEIIKSEKNWKDVWDMHIGIWECYSRTAFTYPEAFEILFLSDMGKRLSGAITEYYAIFPNRIQLVSRYLTDMLRTSDFFERDYKMCRKCVDEGVISEENAVKMNRIVCMIYIGYLKEILKNGIRSEDREDRLRLFLGDICLVIKALAADTLGNRKLM